MAPTPDRRAPRRGIRRWLWIAFATACLLVCTWRAWLHYQSSRELSQRRAMLRPAQPIRAAISRLLGRSKDHVGRQLKGKFPQLQECKRTTDGYLLKDSELLFYDPLSRCDFYLRFAEDRLSVAGFMEKGYPLCLATEKSFLFSEYCWRASWLGYALWGCLLPIAFALRRRRAWVMDVSLAIAIATTLMVLLAAWYGIRPGQSGLAIPLRIAVAWPVSYRWPWWRVAFGLAAIVLSTGLLIWTRRTARWASGPLCPHCRYDLTGNVSGVCPECGMPVPADELRSG